MAQVPVVRTPFTHREFARALIIAWKRIVGTFPTKEASGIIYAHYRLETGDGGYCWNFNIGNQKCTEAMASAGTPYMMLANTWEIIGGKKLVFQPPSPVTWFRAFPSLDEGMTAHLSLLRNKRYASSWQSVEDGDPHEFAVALKKAGYYTGLLSQYSALMADGHRRWMASPAFDDAMADVLATLESPTLPGLDDPTLDDDQPVVRPPIDFPVRLYPDGPGNDDEPPDAA